ncbi:hypothetical protein SO802_022293 [Lithocarpus litseifolius]|uniref:Uncharacterized protein n=1 Tax=Lithocarpus litseifolius TaxID=425828 RepID=A0AAW2CJM6_9ROSI
MPEETSSEQSSVRDGAGYDEVYQPGHESGDDSSLSSEEESLIQSCDEEGGGGDGVIRKGGDNDARESGSDKGSSGDENSESTSGGSGDDRPFILPKEWMVNHFLPSMTDKVVTVSLACRFTYAKVLTRSFSFSFSAFSRPAITGEQKAFILKVTGIPLEERKCRDLITPDALYAYCGGPEPTEEARRLNNLTRQQMESAKLRAQIRAAAARKKEEGKGKEGVSASIPKGTPKRKSDGAEDRPSKKVTVAPGDHSSKPPSPKHGVGKGLMSARGPAIPEEGRCILTQKGYALEQLDSILGKEEADSCANQSVQELGDSGLFDLARVCAFFIVCAVIFLYLYADGNSVSQAVVRMRAIQVKGSKNEELLARQKKRIANLTNGLEQYKDASRTLNGEIKELKEKLEEGTRQAEQEREARVTAERELTSLLGQVETAKSDAVAKFKTSQAFIDSCVVYYGDGLEDCLKQVKSLFPHLDLSRVSLDDPVPSTPMIDTVFVEDDDLGESEIPTRGDGVVLAQPTLDKSAASTVPSTYPSSPEGFPANEVQDPKGDEAAPDAPVA